MNIRVLVCGGRDFKDGRFVSGILDNVHRAWKIYLLIHGAARGADSLADAWAMEKSVPVDRYPADWERHGRAAGPLRNSLMLSQGKPDLVVAFPGGSGTADMMAKATAAKIVILQPTYRL